MDYDVIVVGGGLAGLACAREIHKRGLSCVVFEAEEKVGGRVRTDIVNGFLLDHGFQVLQTAYPEAKKQLDYDELQLKKFPAGVIIRENERFHTIADPRYHPRELLSTTMAPIGTFKDRLKILQLARDVTKPSLQDLFYEPEQRTIDFLRDRGFSENFIQHFFVPFFAGACLDRSITASSRILKYIFRMFASGDAALPAIGMGEIPAQIASSLPSSAIRTNCKVSSVHNGSVTLENGELFTGRIIVMATSQPVLEDLLKLPKSNSSIAETCFYYSAEWQPPFKTPFLVLNGDTHGPINNIAFPNLIAPEYAPPGKTLIAAVMLNPTSTNVDELEKQLRAQLKSWFGNDVDSWVLLRAFRIPHALPTQQPPTANPYQLPDQFDTRIRICGEYQSLPGIQWALLSGRQTAEAIMDEL
jgi:phytoene dehydrogenase-like protein